MWPPSAAVSGGRGSWLSTVSVLIVDSVSCDLQQVDGTVVVRAREGVTGTE